MFTVTFILYERPGIERTDALAYWGDTHAKVVSKVPGLQYYVQHHAVSSPEEVPPFLGVASMGFPDQEAFASAAASPEFAAAVADVPNFADGERLPTGFTEEHVIVG